MLRRCVAGLIAYVVASPHPAVPQGIVFLIIVIVLVFVYIVGGMLWTYHTERIWAFPNRHFWTNLFSKCSKSSRHRGTTHHATLCVLCVLPFLCAGGALRQRHTTLLHGLVLATWCRDCRPPFQLQLRLWLQPVPRDARRLHWRVHRWLLRFCHHQHAVL